MEKNPTPKPLPFPPSPEEVKAIIRAAKNARQRAYFKKHPDKRRAYQNRYYLRQALGREEADKILNAMVMP